MKTIPVSFNLPVEITKGKSGLYFATSPLMKGLLACGDTEEEALRDVADILPKLSDAAMSVSAALSAQETKEG